jgi:predicted nucleotidyltransferase
MKELADAQGILVAFCRKWKVRELSVFGSFARGDEREGSDLDLLVAFSPDAPWSLLDLAEMTEELSSQLGRPVDLVEEGAIINPFRRRAISAERRILYAA